jgi:hypothetical protein
MESNEATTTEHKLTAAQVERDCPAILQDLGKCIAVHLDKARKCEEKAEQHYTAIAQHLAKAKEACDDGGLNAFRERFFPDLGKSRVYELLAIANNKKSVEEIKASTRARVAKHRANKAGAPVSVTVTEKSGPEAEGAPTEAAPVDAPSIVPEQRPEAAAPRRAVTSKDEASFGFAATVLDLVRRTHGQKVGRFAKTAVKADDLAKLGKFLTDLADLKKASAESVEQSTSRRANTSRMQ